MRRLLSWSGWLWFGFSVCAAPLKVDILKVGSRTYTNVTIVGANATDLYFTHSQGIANVKLKYLDESLRQKFKYDAQAAAEAERQQTLDDAAYQRELATELVAKVVQAVREARNAARSSENSLEDPISDRSLLGKPAPAIEVEKWLGAKPLLKGKAVLVVFWAPWSIPCQKAIPGLNALQKSLESRLTVVGVTSDTQEEVEKMAGPRPEFAVGLDTKGKLSAAAAATSVPYVLLLDSKGIVRYQGHPSAMDQKSLENLLSRPAG
jgi:thiol-disulfide isomerase/thioredoxin